MMRRSVLYMILGMVTLCFLYATAEAAECRYISKAATGKGQPEITTQRACGEFSGQDEFRVYPGHFAKLLFKNGLATFIVDNKAFYISESGKAVRVHLFENGADYFSEGLTRTISGGKFGYIDSKLDVIIKPAYDFAFPFMDGRAVVCVGCTSVADGEHRIVKGGKWGVIDYTGAIVIPIRYTREALEKMQGQNNKKTDNRSQ